MKLKPVVRWFKKGAMNVLLAGDQFINALTGGDPDESISSRAGKAMERPKPPLWAKFVHWITEPVDKDHVHEAIERDEGKDSL